MRHQSLLSLLFVMFAALASFAHAGSEAGAYLTDEQNQPYAANFVLSMTEAAAHSIGSHSHHHNAGDHSQASTQVAVGTVRHDDVGQSWWRPLDDGSHFALYSTLERPPRV